MNVVAGQKYLFILMGPPYGLKASTLLPGSAKIYTAVQSLFIESNYSKIILILAATEGNMWGMLQ